MTPAHSLGSRPCAPWLRPPPTLGVKARVFQGPATPPAESGTVSSHRTTPTGAISSAWNIPSPATCWDSPSTHCLPHSLGLLPLDPQVTHLRSLTFSMSLLQLPPLTLQCTQCHPHTPLCSCSLTPRTFYTHTRFVITSMVSVWLSLLASQVHGGRAPSPTCSHDLRRCLGYSTCSVIAIVCAQ